MKFDDLQIGEVFRTQNNPFAYRKTALVKQFAFMVNAISLGSGVWVLIGDDEECEKVSVWRRCKGHACNYIDEVHEDCPFPAAVESVDDMEYWGDDDNGKNIERLCLEHWEELKAHSAVVLLEKTNV